MKKIILTAVIALSMAFTSCDDYLDINNDPQSPNSGNLTPSLIFPGAEMAFCNAYGDYFRIVGGYFAQHSAQQFGTSNYLDYSKFMMSATRSDRAYQQLTMRCLGNMTTVRAMAEASGEWGTALAVAVFRAAAYQTLTDCYGEIPYSEALDINNVNPKYDNGADIYAGIIAELDNALSKVNGNETVCTNFLLGGERASEWIKLANSLKLRILMRESDAVDVKAKLDALMQDDNFITEDVKWDGIWSDITGQANPYYTEEFAPGRQQNVVMNLALAATFKAANDPRMEAWYNPNISKGEYTGGVSGVNFSPAPSSEYNANYFNRPNIVYNSPVYFMTLAEVEFFKAEYEARYGSAAAAKEHYEAAIAASFATAGVNAATTDVLTAFPYDQTNYKRCIGIQKWVALAGTNSYEAYCEMRRLGYPAFGDAAGIQIYNINASPITFTPSLLQPGELYTPVLVNTNLGNNKLLQRWPYPESSANRNANAPKYPGDDKPIFWAGK